MSANQVRPDRWRGPNGYAQFIEDVGPCPSDKHRLFRLDVSQPHGPGNSVWVDRSIQQLPAKGRGRFRHGMKGTKTYCSWVKMRERCYDPRHKGYDYYGGRGITVCDRWLGDVGFDNFLVDMGERPSRYHTLDRIDMNGNYEPTNCRWATYKTQARNTRRASKFEPHEPAQIRWLASLGYKQREIASFFEVSRHVIKQIVAGKTWAEETL